MFGRGSSLAAGFIACVLSATCAWTANAADRQCAAEARTSVPADRLDAMARGFNLNGWLDTSNGVAPDMAALAALRARGFTHIRLPIEADRYVAPFSDPDAISRNFAELDAALDQLQALGFAVSINVAPGERLGRLFQSVPDVGLQLVKGLWREIARRYANRSAEALYFEVLNEPAVPAQNWQRKGPDIVGAIRRKAPKHTIIYPLTQYQRLDEMTSRKPLAEPNVVYAAHYYDPMVFTHQGSNWNPGPLGLLKGVPFPLRAADPAVTALLKDLHDRGRAEAADAVADELDADWDDARIDRAIGDAARWARQNDVPIIINEFGVLSWVAPRQDRLRWYGTVRRFAESHCIGWALWDYADGFGFVERKDGIERPDEDMLVAVFGSAPQSSNEAIHP